MVGSAGDLVLRDGGVSSVARYVSVTPPFIFSTGRGKKTETNQMEVTNRKLQISVWGGDLVIRRTSVCAGHGKHESALSLLSHSDAVSWSGWLCSKRRKILIGQKSTY